MQRIRRLFAYCLLLSLIAGFGVTCGKKGPSMEERLKDLQAKGVPDSVLTDVKMHLYNSVNLAKIGQGVKAGLYKDSLKTGLAKVEAWYAKAMVDNKTFIEAQKKIITEQKSKLTGIALEDCDSMLKVADSFASMNWLIQARQKIEKINEFMPILLKNQERAAEIRPKLVGTWKDVHILRPPEDEEGANYKAVETSVFTFAKDGNFNSLEEKHGQTTPFLKEDWKFLSWGTYDLLGDTIYLFVNREKCEQQIFTQLNVKTNKWDKKQQPTYDSTITNHKKDKFIVFDDEWRLAFKKVK
jgi:hypothetical protein